MSEESYMLPGVFELPEEEECKEGMPWPIRSDGKSFTTIEYIGIRSRGFKRVFFTMFEKGGSNE